MNRFLHIFNAVGVLALAILCVIQWQANRQFNLRVIALEKDAIGMKEQLNQKEKAIKGNVADLDDFRGRLETSEEARKQSDNKLKTITGERDHLTVERDQ